MTQNISNSHCELAKKSLEYYKQIYLYPRLFVNNYFIDLRTEIDTVFALREQTVNLKRNWLQLIAYIEVHESECLKLTGTHFTQLTQCDLISQDEETLLENSSNWNVLYDLLADKIRHIETKLFLNKTLIFLTDSNCALEIFDKVDTELDAPGKLCFFYYFLQLIDRYNHIKGKLICVQNEYLNSDDLDFLKK